VAEKILKIKILTELAGEQALKTIVKELENTDVKIKKLNSILEISKNGVDFYTHSVVLASKSLENLQKSALGISSSALDFKQAKITSSASAAAELERKAVQNIDAQIIQDAFNTQKRLEQIKISNRTATANLFQQETSNIVNELNNRLALEQSIRINGANSIKTIELRAAQEEIKIKQNLASELRKIDAGVAAGSQGRDIKGRFTNQQPNTLRTALIQQTEAQINANRESLLAAQRHAQQADALSKVTTVSKSRIQTLEDEISGHQSLAVRVAEIIGLYRVYNFALNTVINAIKAIPKIGIDLQATQATLTSTIGTSAGMAGAMKFLKEEAERTGIAITTVRNTFSQFQASTSLAGESLQSTVNIFRSMNSVVTSLHLPTEKAAGIFNALAQIFNKSKVQSEELVKQLGNLIPGAFAAFAAANRSQFTSSTQLIAELRKGNVFAHETVEKFAIFLENRFAGAFALASQGINANIGRLQTSFTLLGESIFKTAEGPMLSVIKSLTNIANAITKDIEGFNIIGKTLEVFSALLTAIALKALVNFTRGLFLTVTAEEALALSVKATTPALAAQALALEGTTIASRGLKAAMAFLISPTTIIVGIGLIILELKKLADVGNIAKENLDNILAEFQRNKPAPKDATIGEQIQIKAGQDPKLILAKEQLKILENDTAKIQEQISNIKLTGIVTPFVDSLEKELRAKVATINQTKEFLEESLFNIKEDIEKAAKANKPPPIDFLEGIENLTVESFDLKGKRVEAAAARFINRIENKTLFKAANKLIGENLKTPVTKPDDLDQLTNAKKFIQQFNENLELTKKAAANSVGGGSTQKNLFKDLERDSKAATDQLTGDLKRLSNSFEDNKISIANFFSQKQALQEADLGRQIEITDRSIAIAKKAGDAAKIEELRDKKQSLFQQAGDTADELNRERFKALEQFNIKLQEIRANSLDITGQKDQANLIRTNVRFLNDEKLIRINLNKEAEKQLAVVKQHALAEGEVNILLEKESREQSILATKENSIHIARQTGIINQQQAARQILEARKLLLDSEDREIDKLQQIVNLNRNDVILADKLADAKARQEARIASTQGAAQRIVQENLPTELNFITKNDQDILALKLERDTKLGELEKNIVGKTAEEVNSLRTAANDRFFKGSLAANLQYSKGIANVGSTVFQGLTDAAVKQFGAQSKEARRAFIAFKAFKIAELSIQIASNIAAAFGAGASVPLVGPVTTAPLYAGLAAALGAVQLAAVVSQQPPAAHGGLDFVPKEQTFLLNKGERVLSPNQNKDLTGALANGSIGNNQPPIVNVKNINVLDPSIVGDYLSTREGEENIMNIVKRNQAA
jgi:hypothetical protein